LVKRLKYLQKFHYAEWGNIEGNAKKAIDFNILWQSLTHLNHSITEITIESFSISLRNFQDSLTSHFEKLERLFIRGFIIGNLYSKELFNSGKLYIEIERLVVDDEKSLNQALETLSKMSREVRISINLDVRKINSSIFNPDLTMLIKKILKQKTIKLKLTNLLYSKPEALKPLESSLDDFEPQGNLVVTSKTGKKSLFDRKSPNFPRIHRSNAALFTEGTR